MKVREDEMYWVLKQSKKKGLKELAEANIVRSDDEEQDLVKDSQGGLGGDSAGGMDLSPEEMQEALRKIIG
jgi:hypothetical protein